jgi:hypothetical protein
MALIDGGYVRLYRKLLENPIWTQLSPASLKVAVYFLLRANWRAANWYDGRKKVSIPRGAFVTSYASVAIGCALTLKQVRLAFAHLGRLEFASYSRDGSWTMVAVTNYQDYQAEGGLEGGTDLRAGGDAFSGQGKGTDCGRPEGIARIED